MKKFFTVLLMALLLATSAFARPYGGHGGHFRPEPPRHSRPWSRPSYHHKSSRTGLAVGLIGGALIGGYLLANNRPQPVVQYVPQPYVPAVNYVQRQNSGVTCTTTVVNGVTTMQNCVNNPTINSSYIYYD